MRRFCGCYARPPPDSETSPNRQADHARTGHRLAFVRIGRRDVVAVGVAVVLVVAAFVVPRLHLGIVTPLINSTPSQIHDFANTAPIFGWWNAHVGWGSIPAIVIGVAAVLSGPTVAQRLPWRALTLVSWATSCAWAFSLAMIDGWQRGFAGRLTARNEYLRQVPTITDIPEALRTFSSRILDFQPNSWITHVSGHPPGALLTFVWLDRIGLGGGAWAGALCLLVGSSAAAAIVVAARAVADEQTARLAAPFVAVAPTAIWIAVSADGYFAGVAAWGIALLALATRRSVRVPVLAAAGAGLLLGWAIFLNYGLTLMVLPALAVLVSATDWRAALRALVPAALVAAVVVAVFAVAGFWWFDGYTLVQQRYWQGIALNRPFQYWSWANLASVVCAIGLGSVAGIGRAFDIAAIRRRSGFHLVVLAALAAILCADLTMLSKAETERIWLPFMVWLTAAAALLPPRSHRWWLALNVIGALALNHFILTNW
jgi:methylthioxylose transferase